MPEAKSTNCCLTTPAEGLTTSSGPSHTPLRAPLLSAPASLGSQGPDQIVGKLMKLQFQQCLHTTTLIDAQPTVNNGVLVFCTGHIQTEGQERPLMFSEVFTLMPTPEGSFYVYNNIFRLNLG